MTVGIGFGCSGGLILGADRQMTRAGLNKYHEQKVFHKIGEGFALVLVGADDLNLVKEVWDKLIQSPLKPNIRAIRDHLEGILNDLGRLYSDLPLQLILGIATDQDTALIEFRGKGLGALDVWGGFSVIGIADSSLVRYFARNIDYFWMDTNEGLIAAVYILKRTEEFVDMCSGPMDIIALQAGPVLQQLDPSLVDLLDAKILSNHRKVFTELFSLSPPFSI